MIGRRYYTGYNVFSKFLSIIHHLSYIQLLFSQNHATHSPVLCRMGKIGTIAAISFYQFILQIPVPISQTFSVNVAQASKDARSILHLILFFYNVKTTILINTNENWEYGNCQINSASKLKM